MNWSVSVAEGIEPLDRSVVTGRIFRLSSLNLSSRVSFGHCQSRWDGSPQPQHVFGSFVSDFAGSALSGAFGFGAEVNASGITVAGFGVSTLASFIYL